MAIESGHLEEFRVQERKKRREGQASCRITMLETILNSRESIHEKDLMNAFDAKVIGNSDPHTAVSNQLTALNKSAKRYCEAKKLDSVFGFYANAPAGDPDWMRSDLIQRSNDQSGYLVWVKKSSSMNSVVSTKLMAESATMKIWGDLLNNRRVQFIYSEPLFWKSGDGRRFFRELDVNEKRMRDSLPQQYASWQSSFHYLSAGEVFAAFRLQHLLFRNGLKVNLMEQFMPSNQAEALPLSETEPLTKHLIAIGSHRTSGFLRDIVLPRRRFLLRDKEIFDTKHGTPLPLASSDGQIIEYAVVIKCKLKGLADDCRLIAIGSNHGRAAEAAARVLSEPAFWEQGEHTNLNWADHESFEMVVETAIPDEDREGSDIRIRKIVPLQDCAVYERRTERNLKSTR